MLAVCVCCVREKILEREKARAAKKKKKALAAKKEKKPFTFVSAGMFILLFIATIALVAPAIASAIACVDLSVASRRETAWSCAFSPWSFATLWRLRTSDCAITRTASICPSFAAFFISATSFFSWDWRPMRSRSRSRMARSSWRLFSRRSSVVGIFCRGREEGERRKKKTRSDANAFFFSFLPYSPAGVFRLPKIHDIMAMSWLLREETAASAFWIFKEGKRERKKSFFSLRF